MAGIMAAKGMTMPEGFSKRRLCWIWHRDRVGWAGVVLFNETGLPWLTILLSLGGVDDFVGSRNRHGNDIFSLCSANT
jgi:hypothetical protein